MKKKTSTILVLSAFAALVLAGCNVTSGTSSPADNSSAVSAPASESEPASADSASTPAPSTPASSASTPAPSTPASSASSSNTPKPSTPASSSNTPKPSTPASSSSAAASSSSAASSSRPKTWTEMGVVGEYKGGMTSLIVNADGTTSWGTSTDRFPATCIEVGNGVYHIVSAASVEEEDRIDVYTDGTMAYVVHDETSYDNYVMDKNATGASATAFAETEDESKFFGGVEISNGHWKYFANMDGTYHFGVSLTLQAGSNISNGGAIFDVTLGGVKSTFRVTTAASNVGTFAKVEAFNLTLTTFTGDNGDLVIGRTEGGELVFAKLDGTELPDASLTGDVLTVVDPDSVETVKNEDGVVATCTTTTYTLASIARTYTVGSGEVNNPLFHALQGNTGTYSTEVGADGNLWATFKSPIGGSLNVTETVQVPGGYNGGVDTYITVYKASATTNYTSNSVSTSTGVVLATDSDPVNVTIDIEPNTTYVIKIGGYEDRAKNYNGTGSLLEGETEAISWTFTPNTLETYSGDLGELSIEKKGNVVKNVSLDGTVLEGYRMSGNTLTLTAKSTDTTDPTDVAITTTVTTITLDPETLTYTSNAESSTVNPFLSLSASDTSFSHATDESGNNWITFTPAINGVITITETDDASIDTYLAVYDLTALGNDISKLSNAATNAVAYTDSDPAILNNIAVLGGHTYVIKHGAYAERNTLVGATTTNNTARNKTLTFDFSFVDLVPVTYTGSEGDLVAVYKSGELHHATLAGNNLDGAILEEGNIVIKGAPTVDTTTNPDDPTMTSIDTIFTLDEATHTYVKTTPTVTTNVINVLSETSTGLSGVIGPDGSLWASFTPTSDGYISIDETIQGTNGTSHDTLVSVFEKRATGAQWSDYRGYSDTSNGSLQALNYDSAFRSGADNGFNPVYVHDLPVQAGHTYIIKIGMYAGNSYYIGNPMPATNSAYVGSPEAFTFSFDKIETVTFSGDEGELELTTFGGKLQAAKLDGTVLPNDKVIYDHEAGTLSRVGNASYDLVTDPLDPVENRTDKVYTLDRDAGTYAISDDVVSNHIFNEITPDTVFNGVTGRDGNYYAKYTATADGVITVKDIKLANSYDYVVVYEAKPTNTPSNYKGYSNSLDNNYSYLGYKYCSSANTKTDNIEVTAGKTYIIKVCSYSTKDYAPGQTAAASYQGLTGQIELNFTPYVYTRAAGARGELCVTTLAGNVTKVSLDGNVIPGATVSEDGKTVTVKGSAVVDYSGDEPVIATPTTTYTINDEGTEYTVETTSENRPIYQLTATADGQYSLETGSNGLALVRFVAPTSGQYTISATMPSADDKLGVYTDAECTTLVAGTSVKDSAFSGGTETVTFTAVAGQVYYIKVAQYGAFSNSVTSTTTSTYADYEVDIVIEAGSSSSSGTSTGGGYYDDDDYWDDYDYWDW